MNESKDETDNSGTINREEEYLASPTKDDCDAVAQMYPGMSDAGLYRLA